jgi:formate hydrogenlyase subunit 3/multisubunit Na+/H+ antiporter MnhD subunit
MAFVLIAAGVPSGSLLIGDAVASLATSPWRDYAMAFLILAFGLKIGLFPFHVWMPLTYSAAPIAAAAVLSGSAVKVGVIGLIRFLPFDSAMPDWGGVLVIAGLFSAFYGVVIGITQANLKTVLRLAWACLPARAVPCWWQHSPRRFTFWSKVVCSWLSVQLLRRGAASG